MDITSDHVAAFRLFYTEFNNANLWSSTMILDALTDSDAETGSSRWGSYGPRTLKQRGMFAWVAHSIVMSTNARRAVEAGLVAPATSTVASKTVGDESVSFAVFTPGSQNEANEDANLRTTFYGSEFLRLRKRAGMGPMCV